VFEHALDQRATSSSSLKGFWMKSIAPFFMLSTAIGTSPWPVMTTIGRGERRSISRSCNSRPVMPAMRMSTIKQATSRGSYRERKDSAESKQRTLIVLAFEQPLQRIAYGFVVVDDIDRALLRNQTHAGTFRLVASYGI
jgi:hypothetical protein